MGVNTSPLPIIAAIMEVADHPNVAVCWNSNAEDLRGEGLAHNFKLVEKRLGATTHVHDLAGDSYPYAELFALLKAADYEGWLLEEASTTRETASLPSPKNAKRSMRSSARRHFGVKRKRRPKLNSKLDPGLARRSQR